MDPEYLVELDNLTRRFHKCDALAGVSFRLARGQIAALLGPNGSGKTTLLRILACALAPTSGTARVAGQDVVTQSIAARRRIGYLPECLPLYPEMRVHEYLAYRGQIKGLRRTQLASAMRNSMDRCGVADVAGKLVGTLSLGYRKRIGLADCLLSEPDVLLLDEPLEGLDPAQAHTARDVLRTAGRHASVIFSTHDLPEAESICNVALILNAGRLAAVAPPADLPAIHHAAHFEDAYLRLTTPPPKVQNPKTRKAG